MKTCLYVTHIRLGLGIDRARVRFIVIQCLKKLPIFKLSVTSSNLNRFSNFYTARKRMEFATKTA